MRLTFRVVRTPHSAWFHIALIAFWVLGSTRNEAQQMHPYRTPDSIALATALQRDWESNQGTIPLMDLIQTWKLVYSLPVWLDRRIASDYEVSLDKSWPTVSECLSHTASQIEADIAYVDGVVMLVPLGWGPHFEDAYWSLASQGTPIHWLRREDLVLAWDDGAVASDVLRAFTSRYPIEDFQPEQIEHDVWRSARWEKTTPAVVAIGLLGGFDWKPVLRQGTIVAEPMRRSEAPSPVAWEYRDEIARLGKERWQRWRERWKDVEVRRGEGGGPSWNILAPATAHGELVRVLAPPPKKTPQPDRSKSRYTGRYRGELQTILRSLAKQKQLELDLPDLPPQVLRQELDLAFEQATFDEILAQIGTASGLQLQLEASRLVVTPR